MQEVIKAQRCQRFTSYKHSTGMSPLVRVRHSRNPEPWRHQPKSISLMDGRLMQTLIATFRDLSYRLPLPISLCEDTQPCQCGRKTSLMTSKEFLANWVSLCLDKWEAPRRPEATPGPRIRSKIKGTILTLYQNS